MKAQVITIFLFLAYCLSAPLSSYFNEYKGADKFATGEKNEFSGEFEEDGNQETEESQNEKEKSIEISYPPNSIDFFLSYTDQLRSLRALKTLSLDLGQEYPPPRHS